MTLFRIPFFFPLLFHKRVWRFKNKKNVIYLTFDDGPLPDLTPWILDCLKRSGMRATFFCVGENVVKYPEIYERILEEGHSVGNHTMRHENGLTTPFKYFKQSVVQASYNINSTLFRPPYGRLTWRQLHFLRKNYKIIMWSWLSYDFNQDVPVEAIVESAKFRLKEGDIAVFHDNPKSAERLKLILPEVLKHLIENNLKSIPIQMD
jgi:peptidoglycan/xylan/chitin deacetylase (PgdA/CDA1 family)